MKSRLSEESLGSGHGGFPPFEGWISNEKEQKSFWYIESWKWEGNIFILNRKCSLQSDKQKEWEMVINNVWIYFPRFWKMFQMVTAGFTRGSEMMVKNSRFTNDGREKIIKFTKVESVWPNLTFSGFSFIFLREYFAYKIDVVFFGIVNGDQLPGNINPLPDNWIILSWTSLLEF